MRSCSKTYFLGVVLIVLVNMGCHHCEELCEFEKEYNTISRFFGGSGSNTACHLNTGGDPMVGAVAYNLFGGTGTPWSKTCGACVHVKGPDGEVTVKLVDGCGEGINLSYEAFNMIADPNSGFTYVTWNFVECPNLENKDIKYKFKAGSNSYWFGIQPNDHAYPVQKMELRKMGQFGDAWTNMVRDGNNFYQKPNEVVNPPFEIRMTSWTDELLYENKSFTTIPISESVLIDGTVQFTKSSCSGSGCDCQNGGNCVENECECLPGFSGSQCEMDDVQVDCFYDRFQVVINKSPSLPADIYSLHLNDKDCTGIDNGTHIIIGSQLDQCKTTMKVKEEKVEYHNIVFGYHTDGILIYSDTLRFDIFCQYAKNYSLQINYQPHFHAVEAERRDFGSLRFMMDFYHTDNFEMPYDLQDYPIDTDVGEEMYGGITVISSNDELSLEIKSCKATPNINPWYYLNHEMIADSCPMDDNVIFYPTGDIHKKHFSFKTFAFADEDTSEVYLHCDVFVRNITEGSSKYQPDCSDLRQKRSLDSQNEESVVVTLGPLKRKKRNDYSLSSAISGVKGYVKTSYVITMFVGVMLIIGLVGVAFYIFRSRSSKKKPSYTRIENENEN